MHVLIKTKFIRPPLPGRLINRPRLIDALNAALDKRLVLVSAPAGYGKTTLLTDWLYDGQRAWAWLSLDADDNDLGTFLAYLVAAVQAAEPGACRNVRSLLKAQKLPPVAQVVAMLINDLSELPRDFVLVLEDYHLIGERAVHELVSALVYHCPSRFHLVISTRTDPPMPLAQWRARDYLGEVRAANLRCTRAEAHAFLEDEIGATLPDHVVDELQAITEGWITGLKLAAISLRDRAAHADGIEPFDHNAAGIKIAHSNQRVGEYLLDVVLSRQPRAVREFLMRTSVLDRFTAPLCDALGDPAGAVDQKPASSASAMLQWIQRANLFIVSLDANGRWYRYHHLFRELLLHRLTQKHDTAYIAQLHLRAAEWLEQEGAIGEALPHYLAGGAPERAAELVEKRRNELLDCDDWRTLELSINLLPAEIVQQRPALLAARIWVLSFRGRGQAAAEAVEAAFGLLNGADMPDAELRALRGELEIHRSHAAFYAGRVEDALRSAVTALELTLPETVYVRGAAITAYGLIAQAAGNMAQGVQRLEQLLSEDPGDTNAAVQRTPLTLAWMRCLAGDWGRARANAERSLKLAAAQDRSLLIGWSHLFLGWCYYQHNQLDQAVEEFDAAVKMRYGGVHWRCLVSCLIGLSASYLAQGKTAEAEQTADYLDEFVFDARDSGLLTLANSYRARLSLLQGDIAPALDWARTSDDQLDFTPFLWSEAPLVTRVQAFVADRSPESLSRARELLPRAIAFARATHNRWREVELVALQALALHAEGDLDGALTALDQALELAEPGRFVRTFVDLGDAMEELLAVYARRGRHAAYARELQAVIDGAERTPQSPAGPARDGLAEPLTARELEILILIGQYKTNDEIARALFISPLTVKSHVHNLFAKLGVTRRRFAIERARELGLLPATWPTA